jgi:hypothetical protein
MVVNIPIEGIEALSRELKKRDMLVPAEIILDNILETRADLPINAIHMYSGFKADLYPARAGDELRASAFAQRQKIDMGYPFGVIYAHSPEDLIIYKVWYYSLSFQTKHVRDVISICHRGVRQTRPAAAGLEKARQTGRPRNNFRYTWPWRHAQLPQAYCR